MANPNREKVRKTPSFTGEFIRWLQKTVAIK